MPGSSEPSDDSQAEPGQIVLVYEIVGRILGILRRRYSLNQRDVSTRAGWPQSMVSKIERGKQHTNLVQLAIYASVLTQVDQQIRGDSYTGWSSSELIFVSEHVTRRLIKAGYKVRWATEMTIQDPTRYTRGTELTKLVLKHWPRKMRDRL